MSTDAETRGLMHLGPIAQQNATSLNQTVDITARETVQSGFHVSRVIHATRTIRIESALQSSQNGHFGAQACPLAANGVSLVHGAAAVRNEQSSAGR